MGHTFQEQRRRLTNEADNIGRKINIHENIWAVSYQKQEEQKVFPAEYERQVRLSYAQIYVGINPILIPNTTATFSNKC